MRKLYFLVLALLCASVTFGQLTGPKTIPGDYATISAAVTALNGAGVGAGGVTFNVAAGHTETSNIPVINASGTNANPIIFQKSGSGANPKITASTAGTIASTTTVNSNGDGIVVINGGDYITFDGIDLQTGAGFTGNGMYEYGYFLKKASATDASKNVTIKNCSISLNKTTIYSFGIFASNISGTTSVTVTGTGGTTENLSIFNNTISNTYGGISIAGFAAASPYTFYDQNNEIGVGGANVLTNYGGGGSAVYGIYAIYQNNLKISNNSITGGDGTSTNYGIYVSTCINSNIDIENNQVSLSSNSTTSQVSGIYLITGTTAGTSGVLNVRNNVLTNFTRTGVTSGVTYFVYATSNYPYIFNLTGNTIGNSSFSGTGAVYGFYQISNPVTLNITNNTVSNITRTSATSTAALYGINSDNSAATTKTTISGNVIHSLSGSGTTGAVGGISVGTQLSRTIAKNRIYNLSSASASGVVYGITVTAGATNGIDSIYNNYISDLRSPSADAAADAIRGINITSTSTTTSIGLFYNTIYLDASSSGTNFSTSGIFHTYSATSTTASLKMQNNIVVNVSTPKGTGITSAFRRSAATDLGNFNTASDQNLFYAGTPAANQVIFYDGTNSDQTLAAYKSRVSPREAGSVTELPPFVNVSTKPYDLHLSSSVQTRAESNATVIPGITTDFDGDARNASLPDIGADEGNFIALDVSAPSISYTLLNSTCNLGNRVFTATIADISGVPTSGPLMPRVYYKKGTGGWFSNAGSLTSGTAINGTWTFTILASDLGVLSPGEQIFYYVIAQDISGSNFIKSEPSGAIATDVNTVTTHPTAPSYLINYTLGGSTIEVGGGKTFTTLTAAVNAYNTACLTGPVTFTLTDAGYNTNETFPIVISANPNASATNTLTIKPALNTAVSVSSSSASTASALVRLSGADYVTIDGIRDAAGTSLTFEHQSTAANTAVIWLSSDGAGQGATNNTIKNINIIGGAEQKTLTTVTYGMVIGGSTLGIITAASLAGADNDNNVIDTCYFTKVRYGIVSRGASSANPNTGTVIKRNIIGPATFGVDQIGKAGIVVREEDGIQIINNEVRFVGGDFNNNAGGTVRAGIALSTDATWTPTSVFVKNAIVRSNIIHDIQDEKTGAALAIILAGADGTNATNNIVANNFIYNIKANGITGSNQAVGIGIAAGNGDKVVYNSLYMSGLLNGVGATVPTVPNFGIRVASTTPTNLSVLNNIVYMDLVGGGSLKNFCIDLPTAYTWGTGNLDYNNWYANPANPQSNVGSTVNGTNAAFSLSDWRTLSGKDLNSKDQDPQFVSLTDLHLQASSPIDGQGTPVAGITTDIDNQPRSSSFPDMGADEIPETIGLDLKPQGLVSPATAPKGCYGSAESVIVRIKNNGSVVADFTTTPLTITVNVGGSVTTTYTKTLTTGTLTPGSILDVPMTTVGTELNMGVPGVYTFDINVPIAGDVNTANNLLQETRNKEALTAGTVTVTPADYCSTGGKPTLKTTGVNGYSSIQWLQSTSSGSGFTNIAGATTTTFTVASNITQTMYYKLLATCGSSTDESAELNVVLNNPLPLTTTSATRCGVGTVTLAATANSGETLRWYAASTGGSSLATGTSFTTPLLNSTTTYYVGSSTGSTTSSLGLANAISTTGNTGYTDVGLMFDAFIPFTLQSVALYPLGTGGNATITIELRNSSGTVLQTTTASVPTAAAPGVKNVVPLNFNVPVGTGHRLVVNGASGLTSLVRESTLANFSYPYTLAGVASITSAYTGGASASFYYYLYDWKIGSGCEGARVPVTATITNPPALTVTASKTICNNALHQMEVLSTVSDFNSYIWTPATGLFLDAAAAIPYNGTSATTVYVKSSTANSTTYTLTATNTTTNCVNVATSTVVVMPASVLSASQATVCVSGAPTITANPTTGYGAGSLQWQSSPDGIAPYTNIGGATSATYTTPTINQTSYYQFVLKDQAGVTCSQLLQTITVNNPPVTGTTPATRCGVGTVTLGATTNSGNTLAWYTGSTGGVPVGTGTSYTTPSISSNTTYYVAAGSGASTVNTGLAAVSASPTSGAGTTNYGLVFDVLAPFTLSTVTIYPVSASSASGTVTIDVINSSGAVIHTTTVNVTGSPAASPQPQVVTLNFNIQPGNNYKMRPGFTGITGLLFEPAAGAPGGNYGYPFVIPGVLSINTSTLTAAPTNTANNALYYYFYNWQVSVGCEGTRVAVVATVTPPPALTVTANKTICNNSIHQLQVTSTIADFDSYKWTPATNLFTDAAATVPYVAGSNATQVYVKTAIAGSTTYTVTATANATNCVNVANSTVIIMPAATMAAANPAEICVSGTSVLSITPSTGYGAATFQWQSSPDGIAAYSDIAPATSNSYTTPTINQTSYYKLVIKDGAGAVCQQLTKTMIVNNPQLTGTTPATRCGTGTVNLGATATGGTVYWYTASTGGTPIGSGSSFTTPVIASTTTYYAGAVAGPVGAGECATARTAVTATVTSGPNVTVTANKTICNNEVHLLAVTSTLSDFDSYVWSPVTDLYTDAAATVAYTGTNASQVFLKTSTSGVVTYTLTSSNSATSCGGVATSVVTVMPDPTISASVEICVSGTTTLSLNPATGYGTGTFQWQSSPDGNAPYTNISAATANTYTTPTLTQNGYYKLLLKDGAGTVCLSQPTKTAIVNNPQLTNTTPGSRCGTGTVMLGASATGGIVNWYTAATGGTPVANGNSFTTPSIGATTTYYASASQGLTLGSLGLADRVGTTQNTGYTDVGLMFDAVVPFNLSSVSIYPVGTGGSASVTVALRNSAGTILQTTTVNVTTSASPGIKTVVPLNFSVPAGTGHRLVMNGATGLTGLTRELTTGFTYPYTFSGVASITSAYTGGASSSYYYYFYDWKISVGCETSRTAVVATINNTVTNANILAGTSGGVQVCSGNQNVATLTNYFDNCNLIATITPSGGTAVSGNVNACVKVDNAVPSAPNGQKYVQRYFEITPATNRTTATSTVTLYFTQAEFNAYNTAVGSTYPSLPANGADPAKANLKVTQFNHGGIGTDFSTYPAASGSMIDPVDASITYDAAANGGTGRWAVTFDATGSGAFYVHTGNYVLPVTITNFRGETAGSINKLYWSTSTETNNKGFELERSTDGINYTKLTFAATKANGGYSTTQLSYNFDDLKPQPGTNYYRLKQIDNDGKFNYSSVVVLSRKITEITLSKVFPNPAITELNVVITSPRPEKVTVMVTDLTGKIVMQTSTSVVLGENQQQLNVAKLAGGTYMVKVICANGCETAVHRFVKQ